MQESPSKEDIVELPDSTFAMAHVFINSILSINNPPDALFAATDTIAYAAILSAKENGLRVPEDIAIAGFENLNISIMSSPKLLQSAYLVFSWDSLDVNCYMNSMYRRRCQRKIYY